MKLYFRQPRQVFPKNLLSFALSSLVLLISSFALPQKSSASIESMGDAINIAGRQRMLSQRIAQSYLLKGMQPESDRGITLLDRCTREFEQNLKDLHAFLPAASLAADLDKVRQLWIPYQHLVNAPATKLNAELMIEQSNQVLASAHAYVNKLQALSGSSEAELINISGKQRMLSQRIAKNFLARQWGINTHLTTAALYQDLAEYETMLDYLISSDINTPEINVQLQKVKGYFAYASLGFDGVMTLSEPRLIHAITGTTDYMLRGMDITTMLYAKLLK